MQRNEFLSERKQSASSEPSVFVDMLTWQCKEGNHKEACTAAAAPLMVQQVNAMHSDQKAP